VPKGDFSTFPRLARERVKGIAAQALALWQLLQSEGRETGGTPNANQYKARQGPLNDTYGMS